MQYPVRRVRPMLTALLFLLVAGCESRLRPVSHDGAAGKDAAGTADLDPQKADGAAGKDAAGTADLDPQKADGAAGRDAAGAADLDLQEADRSVTELGKPDQAIKADSTPAPPSGSSLATFGAKCDGSTDDRAAIQNAFDNASTWVNKTLIFPAGKTCLVTAGVKITNKSGWTIEGQGATIKAADGMCLDGCGPLMTLSTVDQFAVNNLKLDGNRANRTLAEKYGGHNLQVSQATNGSFRNLSSNNAATDNARIAAGSAADTNTFSMKLTFIDSKFTNAFRNNVSVIEGWYISFLGTCTGTFAGTCTCEFSNANGTAPKAGLGWEPNSGSAFPGADNGLVDGCLMEGNMGSGIYASGGVVRNLTIRNSIMRNNGLEGGLTGSNDGGALAVKAAGALIENNYVGQQAGSRFAVVYVADAKTSNLRAWQFKNNHIDGVPPVAQSNGSRRVLHCGNFGDGTAQFKGNVMTNIGVKAGEDWCAPNTSTCGFGSTVENNTVDGAMQSPNPGCP